jgi:enolase
MPTIQAIKAHQVLDSRGNPTVEAQVQVSKVWYRAMVPSGASTGKHEAVELRDKTKAYHGKGVHKAVKNINTLIAKKLKGLNPTNQARIDNAMCKLDGTRNKHKLGANAILAVSLACARAGAGIKKVPLFKHIGKLTVTSPSLLPVPQMNVINGGLHAGQKNDFQEHMLMPTGAKSFSKALQMGDECYHELKTLLKKKYGSQGILVGDEGGFAPPIKTLQQRLKIMEKAVHNAGYSVGKHITFALDCAATEFYNAKKKRYQIHNKVYDSKRLAWFYEELCEQFPIHSIEDPFAEDDWQAWSEFTKEMGKKVQIVGDDLLVTNPIRIKKAIQKKACNALLLKVNQIGTLTEALTAARIAKKNKWKVIVSHRSGETEDSFIADLAVGINAGQSKFGAPARGERIAKYDQLLRIEEALGKKARYGLK